MQRTCDWLVDCALRGCLHLLPPLPPPPLAFFCGGDSGGDSSSGDGNGGGSGGGGGKGEGIGGEDGGGESGGMGVAMVRAVAVVVVVEWLSSGGQVAVK